MMARCRLPFAGLLLLVIFGHMPHQSLGLSVSHDDELEALPGTPSVHDGRKGEFLGRLGEGEASAAGNSRRREEGGVKKGLGEQLVVGDSYVPFRQHKFDLNDFGAVGDGKTDNTRAFMNGVYACSIVSKSGGSQLYVPPGTYVTHPFNLTSHMTLYLAHGATILGTMDLVDWDLIDPLPSYGRGWDLPGPRYANLISGYLIRDVVITGENGTLDGRGSFWWNLLEKKQLRHTRPHLLEFLHVHGAIVANVTFRNSPFWTIHPVYSLNESGIVRYYYKFVCHGGVAYRREDIRLFKCAFCLLKCRSMEGLQCHLTTYHDYCFIFEFEPQDDPPSVCVSTKRSVRRMDGRLWDPEDLSVPPNKEFIVAKMKNRRKTGAHGMGKGREGKDGSCPSDAVAANAAPMDVENRGESATGADASGLQALPWGHQNEAGSSRPMLPPQGREKSKQSKRVKFPMTEDAGITDDENNREDGAAVGNGEKGWKGKVSKPMRGAAAKMDSAADYRLQIAHADKREGTSPASCREETNEIPWENGRAIVPRSMVLPLNRRKSDLQMTNEERLESREFYHSQTGQRMTREALLGNHDSEDEVDHDVLDFEDRFQLNEFTDVSMVEKDFMFMWNSFRRRNNVLADGHMKWACETFAEQHAEKIGNCYPLRIVFTLFLTKMNKYCVINASTVHKAMTFCNKAAAPMPQASPSETRARLLSGLSKGFSDWVSREQIPNSAAAGGASSALTPKKLKPAQQPPGGSSP